MTRLGSTLIALTATTLGSGVLAIGGVAPATASGLSPAGTPGWLAPAVQAPDARRPSLSRPERRRVERLLRGMTLAEKVGQVFTVAFAGQSASAPDAASAATNLAAFGQAAATGMVRDYHVGGVIYFGANVRSPQQVAQLSRDLQIAATRSGAGVPLSVSIDQEGGTVTRLPAPASVAPGNMAVGATADLGAAHDVARVLGTELRSLGVTWDLAPVVDVNTEPLNAADGSRSFGDDPARVSMFAHAAVDGLHAGGVATSAKHFPGLGSTISNSDFSVSRSDQAAAEFRRRDFPPFSAAIAAGTDSVMTAHLVAPRLAGSDVPTSMSGAVVRGMLRDELGFRGVVVTDTLQAAALDAIPPDRRVVDAFLAGNDVLLMPVSLPSAVTALTDAVADGTVPTARLDRSVRRILTMKARTGMLDRPWAGTVAEIGDTVGTPDHLATMADAADAAITLLAPVPVPLGPATGPVLVAGFGRTTVPAMAGLLSAYGLTVDQQVVGTHPTPAAVTAAVAAARRHAAVVLLTYNVNGDPGQQQLMRALIDTGVPVTVVMVGAPYDAAWADGAAAVLAAYAYTAPNLQAAARALLGRPTTGTLPVAVPAAADPTTVAFPRGWGATWLP